jgi:transposase
MYIDICKYKRGNKFYRRVLLREGYRQNGKVRHRTLANLSHCSDEEIEAMRIALKMKKELPKLYQLVQGKATNGKHIGAVSALYQIADRLGIAKALGQHRPALLVLWLILTRLIDQGSRLSAVRLAQTHAACELLGLDPFTEDDLYAAMDWLYEHQQKIERRLFKSHRQPQELCKLFLYDVTSTYLEGDQNELAAWGYNRDQKKGKKQIVYGLLTDEQGDPVAVAAFPGNIKDNQTVKTQLDKLKKCFDCQRIVFVGDKGMIKSAQIEDLQAAGFHYITSITKPQIRKLLKAGLLRMELFDDKPVDVEDASVGIRYILCRNPLRAEEMKKTRHSKMERIQQQLTQSNQYLAEHTRAKVSVQVRNLKSYIAGLKMTHYVKKVESDEQKRHLTVTFDHHQLADGGKLDGCYVIKTDLPITVASKELVHDRYRALKEVEWAFRTEKTAYLEVRPVYVRKKKRTAAHLFIVMLAYKIEKYLRAAWADFNMTVEEGIHRLSQITSLILTIGEEKIVIVPQPDKECQQMLEKIQVALPDALPYREVNVATKRKLQSRRKSQ